MADENLQFSFNPNNFTGAENRDENKDENRYVEIIGNSVAKSIEKLVGDKTRRALDEDKRSRRDDSASKSENKGEIAGSNQQTIYSWSKPNDSLVFSAGNVLSFTGGAEDKSNDAIKSIESLLYKEKDDGYEKPEKKEPTKLGQDRVEVKKDSSVEAKKNAQVLWEEYYKNRDTKARITKEDERAAREAKRDKNTEGFGSGLLGLTGNILKLPFSFSSAIKGAFSNFKKLIAPAATIAGVTTIGVGTAVAGISELLTNEKARIKAITDMGGTYDEKTKKLDISNITKEGDKKLAQSLINEDGTLKSASETSFSSFIQVIGKNFKDLGPIIKDFFVENVWKPAVEFFKPHVKTLGRELGKVIRNSLSDIIPFVDSYEEIQEDRRQKALEGMKKSPYAFSRQYQYDEDNATKQWVVSNFGGEGSELLFTGYLADTVKQIMKDEDLVEVFSGKFKDEKEEADFYASEFFIKWANSVVKNRSARSGEARTFIIKEGEDTESLNKAIESYKTKTSPIPTVPNNEVEQKIISTEKQQKSAASVENTVGIDKHNGQNITNNTSNSTYTIYNSDPTGHASAAALLTA